MSVIVIDPYEIPNANVYARILLVGGGGGGSSGGGGAGGVLDVITPIYTGYTYNVTVGIGGAQGALSSVGTASFQAQPGSNGTSTIFSGNGVNIIAHGGGGGGGWYATYPGSNTIYLGRSGGSAGGGGSSFDGTLVDRGPFKGGATLEYVTYNGNLGGDAVTTFVVGGGGGGAGESGYSANGYSATTGTINGNKRGKGGDGKLSNITGASLFYGGGGAGVQTNGDQASGGGGSGVGSGGVYNGTDGLGGGGGGSVNRNVPGGTTPGRGGNGRLIISYPGSQKWSGGTVTTLGANTVHTFNANGTLTPL